MKLTRTAGRCALALACALAAGRSRAAEMVVDSLSGPVTAREIQSFKDFVAAIPPATNNLGNRAAYGNQGGAMEALGDMHVITGDKAILDRLIRFSDAILSGRNDLVNGEHTVMFGGKQQPVWPNTVGGTCWGGEAGDIASHLSYTAVRILRTPSLASVTVPDGNPYGFGTTYRDRALRYVKEVDFTIDQAVEPYAIQADLVQRFILGFCYKSNTRVPWNQQTMFNGAFQRQAEAHTILGDAPARVTRYRNIVRKSMETLVTHAFSGSAFTVPCGTGQTCYMWSYDPGRAYAEDAGHAAYDILGVYRAWQDGLYATQEHTRIFANTLMYRMRLSANTFSAKVDGTGGAKVQEGEWFFLAHVLPSIYGELAANIAPKLGTNTRAWARLMYAKHKRNTGEWPGGNPVVTPTPTPTPTSTGPTPTPTPTPTAPPGGGFSGYYRIMARHSGKAVVVAGASTADNADVYQWDYNDNALDNDEWELASLGGGYYRIINRNSGKDLNVVGASTANGANVIQYTYGGTTANDEWQPVDLGNGYFRVVNRHSGKVLNVAGASTVNAGNVDQWSWANVNQQQFQLVAIP